MTYIFKSIFNSFVMSIHSLTTYSLAYFLNGTAVISYNSFNISLLLFYPPKSTTLNFHPCAKSTGSLCRFSKISLVQPCR
jgi:hypothetical protein